MFENLKYIETVHEKKGEFEWTKKKEDFTWEKGKLYKGNVAYAYL